MEPTTLVRTIIQLLGVLVLIMYVSSGKNAAKAEGLSLIAILANMVKVLVFCQIIALVFTFILGLEKDMVLLSSLYCNLMGLGGYAGVVLAQWTSTRQQYSFYVVQMLAFVATVLGICGGAVLANVISHVVTGESFLWEVTGFLNFLNLYMIGGIVVTALLAASFRMFYNFKLFTERELHRQQEFEILRLREQHVSAQLQSIQARINPHFLYNALNSIASLVHEDPHRTEQMTLALSRLLRASLSTHTEYCTTVRQEVALVKTYLEIEEARFGDSLRYTLDVDPEALEEPMPRFLLQPLVENAIKHGVSGQVGQGHIALEIKKDGDALHIAVKDNGPDFPEQMMGGYGWQSVSESLELLYAGRYDLHLINGEEKQVHITLRNPA